MNKKSVTLMNIKEINKNNVYNFIYREKATSKQLIAHKLKMGISTVSQNIKVLEDAGLIERKGSFGSTGGRKADIIRIKSAAKISIGIGILKSSVYIVAVDLYGTVLNSESLNISYENASYYYKIIGDNINNFVKKNNFESERILGVSIATQGTISSDGTSVSYGKIMGNYNMKLSDFTSYIPYKCRLEHDCKAAAYLEIWKNKEINNAVVLMLNRNLGGSLIINKKIIQGTNMHAGALEHLCISKDGPLCYCGNRGCLETYCAASVIEKAYGPDISMFFKELRSGTKNCIRIWHDYLEKLAFAIRNLSILVDGNIIISGYLAPYVNDDDIAFLLKEINTPPFPINRDQISVSKYGQFTPAVGAALYPIEQFLTSV